MPPSNTIVDASCRGWGEHVAVYVPDDVWLSHVSESDVVAIVETFEQSTPADDARGVYDIATTVFGDPPDVDSDPRIVFLYFEMGTFMGSEFDGFFRSMDETSGPNSNMTEMLHMNGVRAPVAQPYMLSIVAHEFQHMLHFRADPDEHSWIDETMSEASMILCGFYTDDSNVAAFAGHPDSSLVVTDYVDYGAVFLLAAYLIEQLGTEFVSALFDNTANGIAGFDAAGSGFGVDFLTVFSDWVVANYLDDPSLDAGQYGYETYDPPAFQHTTNSPDGVLRSDTLSGWAADYIRYPLATAGTDLTVRIDSADWASLGATLLTMTSSGATDPTVTPVSLLSASTEQVVTVPDGHDEAVLVVFSVAEGSFTYESSALW
jgi:hypothetical protein